MCLQQPKLLTRGEFLRVTAGTVAAAAAAGALSCSPAAAQPETTSSPGSGSDADIDSLLGELDDKVKAGMQEYGIPGVALGLIYQGTGYIRGYGVTNVDSPQQVDGETLFRIGSTHQDLHRHRGDATGGAGQARPGRHCANLPARLRHV
jgi:Beta-lactamase